MKMKSNFLGISAKLALAILAVGATFTSCYDSENGDVSKPYTPEPAKYVVTGYVTDFETGAAIEGATVTIGSTTATTTAGEYTITSNSPLSGTVTIVKADYLEVTRTLTMETISTGTAVYTVDAALIREGALPGVKVTVLDADKFTNAFAAENYPIVDLVNDTDEPVQKSLSFTNLQAGARFVADVTTKAENADAAKEAFVKYCQVNLGVNPEDGFEQVERTFEFTLPALSSLKSVSLTTYGVKEVYTFPYEGEERSFTIERVVGHAFVPEIYSNSHYHGHGHGHGLDGDLNAGGGIFE